MSAFDTMDAMDLDDDQDMDMLDVDEETTNVNLSDDMLKINSPVFSKAQWYYLENDKSNIELFQKLSAYGANLREVTETVLSAFSEDEYMGMRKHLLDKIGSPGDKCFPDLNATSEGNDEKSKGKDSKKSSSKDAKKTDKGAGKKEVVKKADLIKRDNMMKLIKDDVDKMSVNRDLSLPQIRNWHQPISLLVHVLHWAVSVILSLRDKYKDPSSGKLVSVSAKVALDCAMSLYRVVKDLRDIAPPSLLQDAEFIAEKLSKSLRSKCGEDLISVISLNYPEIISDTSYDSVKPMGISLYAEQKLVLQKIDASLQSGIPLLMGYKVPPSGGKTILSVAIASMLNQHYKNTKKLLYVCYNTLVRLAVSNACYQAGPSNAFTTLICMYHCGFCSRRSFLGCFYLPEGR